MNAEKEKIALEFQRELGSFGEESTGGEAIDSGNY